MRENADQVLCEGQVSTWLLVSIYRPHLWKICEPQWSIWSFSHHISWNVTLNVAIPAPPGYVDQESCTKLEHKDTFLLDCHGAVFHGTANREKHCAFKKYENVTQSNATTGRQWQEDDAGHQPPVRLGVPPRPARQRLLVVQDRAPFLQEEALLHPTAAWTGSSPHFFTVSSVSGRPRTRSWRTSLLSFDGGASLRSTTQWWASGWSTRKRPSCCGRPAWSSTPSSGWAAPHLPNRWDATSEAILDLINFEWAHRFCHVSFSLAYRAH